MNSNKSATLFFYLFRISEKYGKANTYVYTKSLAESLLQSQFRASPFPIAIVRPSIVGTTFDEPLPGDIETFVSLLRIILFNVHVVEE